MSEQRDRVIGKIKKLLALSDNNPSQEEAIAAALKAQKLISEYSVEDFELADDNVDKTIEELRSTEYVGKKWRGVLAAIIAENFRCKNYTDWTKLRYFGKISNVYKQVFVGYTHDATAALLVYEKLVDVGESCAKEVCKKIKEEYGTTQGVKNSFLLGFCYGVKQELEKQAHALMLKVPSTVIVAFEHLDLETGGKWYLDQPTFDCTDEGIVAGREAVRSSRLDGTVSEAEFALDSAM